MSEGIFISLLLLVYAYIVLNQPSEDSKCFIYQCLLTGNNGFAYLENKVNVVKK